MRLFSVATLLLCLTVSAHAQLSFGPGGVSGSPINLVKVFRLIRSVVGSYLGWDEPAKAKENDVIGAESRTDDSADYQSDLQRLKSRIQEASQSVVEDKKHAKGWTRFKGQSIASMRDHQQYLDPESKQAFLLPKTSVVVGKWPWVYGAINVLLLGGLLVLAQPYFYEGETVVTQYENELVNAHGPIDPYGPFPGYTFPGQAGGYGGYGSEPSYESHSVHESYAPVSEELYSAYHQPTYEEQEKAIESAYAKREVPKDANNFRGFGSGPPPKIVKTIPSKPAKHNAVISPSVKRTPASITHSAIPSSVPAYIPSRVPSNIPSRVPSNIPSRVPSNIPSSVPAYIPSRVVARPILAVEPRVPQEGLGNVLNPHPDKESDPPLNELFYYNPTVFTSPEESTYGCLERMVCLNPSRTARSLAQSSASRLMASSMAGSDRAEADRNWAGVMRRLDVAAERGGSDQEECAQYYCPPAIPEVNLPTGEDYIPPPSEQIPTIATTQAPKPETNPTKVTTRKRVTTYGARREREQPESHRLRTNSYSQISTQQADASEKALPVASSTRREVPRTITRKVVTRTPISEKSESKVEKIVDSVEKADEVKEVEDVES